MSVVFPQTLPLRALSLELEVARSPVPHLTDPAVRVLDHRPAALRLTVQHRAAPLPPSEDFREALVGFLRREGARALPPLLARLADEAGIAAFLEEKGFTYPTLMDAENLLGQFFAIQAFPTTFIIKADGSVLGYVQGAVDIDTMREIIAMGQSGD